MTPQRPAWFERSALAWLLIALSAVPLLGPGIPPLTDLPGHIGRYRIELDLDSSPYLHQWFTFKWALFGNIGVDLLVVPLSRIFPLEFAVKLIVLSIPPLTVGGMLFTARELHGRIPASAFFALPLAYCYPFQFGFVNFTLSMALVFLSIGFWLWLGRKDRLILRATLFALISPALFLAHCVGWAVFGAILLSLEVTRQRERGQAWIQAVWRAGLILLPLLTPLFLILNWWSSGPSGETLFIPWNIKIYQLLMVLRDRTEWFDVTSAIMLYSMLLYASRGIGFRFHKGLAAAAMVLFVVYLITPGILKDAAFADMRMLPYALAVALLALEPLTENRTWRNVIALAGILFFVARLGTQTLTYHVLERGYKDDLVALDHVERGSRVYAMVVLPCREDWWSSRKGHLGSMAVVRREAYANGMWSMAGGRLMTIIYKAAGPFTYSPTQLLPAPECHDPDTLTMDEVLALLPRQAFDYVWMIDLPHAMRPSAGWLKRVWKGPTSALYRVDNSSLTKAGQNVGSFSPRIAHGMD
jgi:hypothetical protein